MFPSGSANLAIAPHFSRWGGTGNGTALLAMRAVSASISSVTKAMPVSPGSRGAKPSHRCRTNRSPGGATRIACPEPPTVYVENPRFFAHHFADALAFDTTTATSAITDRPMFRALVNDHRLNSVACASNFRPGAGSPENAVLPTVRSAMGRSTSGFQSLPARSGKRPGSGRGIKGVSAPSLRRHSSPSLVRMPVGSQPSTVAPLRECLTPCEVFGGGRTLRRACSFPSVGNSLGCVPGPSPGNTNRCRRSSPQQVEGSPRREGSMNGHAAATADRA